MKFLLSLILVIGFARSYAGCVADVKDTCKDAAECKDVVGQGGSVQTNFANGVCVVSSEKISDCEEVNGASGAKGATIGTGKEATGTTGTGK